MNDFLSPVPGVVAHRGDSKNYPENTIPAFISAVKMGVDVIETDVHLTKDGSIVIWHDDTLERNTNGKGRIEDHTLSELRELDAGYTFTRDNSSFPFRGTGVGICTLEEALNSCPGMRFNIDLKTDDTSIVPPYIEVLEKCGAESRVCTASFHLANLKAFRKARPDLLTSLTTGEVIPLLIGSKLGILPKAFKRKVIFQVPVSQYGITIVDEKFVRNMHRRNAIIMVWTINERKEMERLFSLGVDTIMTDDPALLISSAEEFGIRRDLG